MNNPYIISTLLLLFLSCFYTANAASNLEETSSTSHTIRFEIASGIRCTFGSGSYSVERSEDLRFTFAPEDRNKTAEDILFLVNGVETPFVILGDKYDYIYNLKNIQSDCSIEIALKTYPVTIPQTEGVFLYPYAGTYEVAYGDKFWFELSSLSGYTYWNQRVYANDIELEGEALPEKCFESVSLRSGERFPAHYYMGYIIESVKSPIVLRIEGIETTGNKTIDELTTPDIYVKDGIVYITSSSPEQVQIFSLSGVLRSSLLVNGFESMTLPKGFYIVKTGTTVKKVIVN